MLRVWCRWADGEQVGRGVCDEEDSRTHYEDMRLVIVRLHGRAASLERTTENYEVTGSTAISEIVLAAYDSMQRSTEQTLSSEYPTASPAECRSAAYASVTVAIGHLWFTKL